MSANRFAEATDIESLMAQAVGAGSACWSHLERAGLFQSTAAREIADDAAARARELLATVRPNPDAAAQEETVARVMYEEDANDSTDPDIWPDFDSPENAARHAYLHRARAVLTALAAMGGDR